jgi:hypothetical protein
VITGEEALFQPRLAAHHPYQPQAELRFGTEERIYINPGQDMAHALLQGFNILGKAKKLPHQAHRI